MRYSGQLGLLMVIASLGVASVSQGALQVALHKVNTSVGLAPTTTANKWALETDPAIDDASSSDTPTYDYSQYVAVEGQLSNTFDPTKFTLATNPYTGDYDLGYTVQGLGAYQVVGFDVELTDGSLVQVGSTDVLSSTSDAVSATAGTAVAVAGGFISDDPVATPDGTILDIHFELIPDRIQEALPADQDQLFYQINLIPIDDGPDFDPGIATTEETVNSFFTVAPISDPTSDDDASQTTVFGGIQDSTTAVVPEPIGMSMMGLGAFGLLGRHRKTRGRMI